MAIALQQFAGTRPAITSRLLPQENAEQAFNLRTENGDIRPLKDWGFSDSSGIVGTIFRHSDFWLRWADDVDVVQSQIVDDVWDRIYWTGEEQPRYKDSTNMSGSGYRRLGVPRPDDAPTLTLNKGIEDDIGPSDDVTRFYLATYVSDRGEEGAPSPVSSSVVLTLIDDTVTVTVPPLAVNNYNVEKVRIYRTATSVSAADWLLVAELPQTTGVATVYLDELKDVELLGSLVTDNFDMPPADLRGLTALPNGIFAGFVGNTVYLSAAYLPYAWPAYYRHACENDVVAIGSLPSGAAILTEGTPYLLMGYSPDSMSLVELEVNEACVSKHSVVGMGESLLYASPDGIVAISGNGAALISKPLIEPEQWQAFFDLPNLRAARYERFYFCCDGTNALLFDPSTGDLRTTSLQAESFYFEALTDTLWGCMSDGEIRPFDEGVELAIQWRSKLFKTPPTSYSYGMVEFKRLGEAWPLVNVFADGVKILTHTPSDERSIFRLPAALATEWQVEVEGAAESVSKLVLASSSREL